MAGVPAEWRGAFVQFVETGETTEAFLSHLDRDPATQQAVELAFNAQSRALEDLAQVLREGDQPAVAPAPAQAAPVPQTFQTVTKVLETALRLPKIQRHAVLEAALTSATQGLAAASADRTALRETLADIREAAGVVEAGIEK